MVKLRDLAARILGEIPPPEKRPLVLEEEDELGGKRLLLNLGPQHPATHGTLRIVVELDGERIVKATPEIGFLHTGFEKLGEHLSYAQFITVTDRMNYMSAINNNVGFAIAVEELLGIEVPPRAQILRVILSEVSRIADHVLCCGLQAMDLGAFSIFLWAFEQREKIYDILEAITGARLTTSWTRPGGLMRDVPPDFKAMVRTFAEGFPQIFDDLETMLNQNRIFMDRLRGVGVLSAQEAVEYAVTGPCLRASGVPHDIRRKRPYSSYEKFDFEVPTLTEGDSFARYRVRILEMQECLKIIHQGLDILPEGPVNFGSNKVTLPEKGAVHQDMESLIHHFKLVMWGHGTQPPRGGEVYSCTEAPNGELGFYLVSDGTMNPYRVRIRPPSFLNYAVFPKLCEGRLLSDAVAILSSLNVIAGELDR